MGADEILMDVEERMEKAVDVLKHALSGIRTGRANPGLVDTLRVEVYGSPTPIKQLASVARPEPTQIVIRPFDPGTIKDIEKAIQASGLGFTPMSDGRVIRLNVPPLSTEMRRKLVSRIKDLSEESKVAIRNVRRDGNKAADQEQKDKTLSEDDCDQVKTEVQELTKKFENRANALAQAKETEVMETYRTLSTGKLLMPLPALDRIRSDRVLLIAHRGDSKLAPENTLPAFKSAAKLGVDFIELDYRHTADDVPLVIHDEFLDRTTDAENKFHTKKIALADKTVAQLQALDAGSWFSPNFADTRLSTLAEVLDALPAACFMVERKGGSAEVCVRVLEALQAVDRVIVQAFDWEFLRECHRLCPTLPLGALGSKPLTADHVEEAQSLGASVMGWKADLLGKPEIERIHAAGMKAWAWTVDDEQRAEQLVNDGLDGLISNRPGVMRKLLASHAR